jgi:hypothetical protein
MGSSGDEKLVRIVYVLLKRPANQVYESLIPGKIARYLQLPPMG